MDELKELAAAKQGSIHCLTIVGQIEGHQILPEDTKATKYEHILPLLAAIEETSPWCWAGATASASPWRLPPNAA